MPTAARCGLVTFGKSFGGKRVLASDAPYGQPQDDPIYQLSPVLHEPSPRSMSVADLEGGWPVHARRPPDALTSDLQRASIQHSAVMGIMHLYIAPGPRPPHVALPGAAGRTCRTLRLTAPRSPAGRDERRSFTPELSKLGSDGGVSPETVADPGRSQVTSTATPP